MQAGLKKHNDCVVLPLNPFLIPNMLPCVHSSIHPLHSLTLIRMMLGACITRENIHLKGFFSLRGIHLNVPRFDIESGPGGNKNN